MDSKRLIKNELEEHGNKSDENITPGSQIFKCLNCGTFNEFNYNSKKTCKIKLPDGLESLLVEFTVNLIKNKPLNLNEFAIDYFKRKENSKMQNSTQKKTVCFNNKNINDNLTENDIKLLKQSISQSMNLNENCVNETFDCNPRSDEEDDEEKNLDNNNNNNYNNNKDDYDDEPVDLVDLKSYQQKKTSGVRRYSVFSKSYDPESNDVSDSLIEDETKNEEENSSLAKIKQEINDSITTPSSLYDEDAISNQNLDYEIEKNHFYEKQIKKKTIEERENLKKVLLSIVLFKHMCDEDMEKIIDSMFEKKCSPNELIIREGDNGYYFYIILSGDYDIFIRSKESTQSKENINNTQDEENLNQYGKKVSELNGKGFFGELSLLYNQPRSATIISKTNGVLSCMNRDKFQRLVIGSAFKRRCMYEEFLASVPLLKESMNEYERSQVADALTSRSYAQNECIFKQDDLANGMFFIESGSVRIIKGEENEILNSETKPIELRILKIGEYFGELALVNKAPRSASAYAQNDFLTKTPCKLAFLDLKAFERLMGPCIDKLKHRIGEYYE